MPKVYQTKIWQAEIPDTWTVESDREQRLVMLFKPDGLGTLKIFVDDEGPPTDRDGGAELYKGRLRGRTWSSCRADRFERYWILWCSGHRLLVSYWSAAKNADVERTEVDEIIRSISESDGNA